MTANRTSEIHKTTYRFDFFRNIVNGSGDCYRCKIDTIEIAHARSSERALTAALRLFERRHHLSSWDHLAHGYETRAYSAVARPSPGGMKRLASPPP